MKAVILSMEKARPKGYTPAMVRWLTTEMWPVRKMIETVCSHIALAFANGREFRIHRTD
jgi:hypothetical protein